MKSEYLLPLLVLVMAFIQKSFGAIQCYQCGSSQEPKGVDLCGAYKSFDHTKHVLIDCYSEEAVTPGQFCLKRVELSPRGYIWDGRWKSVIRRCATMSNRGLNAGCDWGYTARGTYWEECYCNRNGCNGAEKIHLSVLIIFTLPVLLILIHINYF